MKNYPFKHSILALAVGLLAVPALAADLPVFEEPAAAVAAAPYDWSGFYAGLHVGWGWGDVDTDTTFLPSPAVFGAAPFSQSTDIDGILGGVQAGVNWQTNGFVFGIEGDISYSGMDGTSTFGLLPLFGGGFDPGSSQTVTAEMDWFGTLRLRSGITAGERFLIYATGGLAVGHVEYSVVTDFVGAPFRYLGSSSDTEVGWTVGAGGELAAGNGWSLKGEYLYFDLGGPTIVASPVAPNPPFQVQTSHDLTGHIVRIGVNRKFP